MSYYNIWVVFSDQALTAFKARRQAERGELPYSGPMDKRTYNIMQLMAEQEVVELLFKPAVFGAKTYNLFSLYTQVSIAAAEDALDYLEATWPDHFIVIGSWNPDGTQVEDESGPLFPIPSNTFKIMPDTVIYDEAGNETSRTVASSNADLKDVNLIIGQSSRIFT